jgi:hypothetical protein
MSLSPLAVAVQGLGFTAAIIAIQGLLAFVAQEVAKNESGGGIKTRRRIVGISPMHTPARPIEEDDALLLIGLI